MRKPSSESSESLIAVATDSSCHLILKMASAQVVEISVANNSTSQDSRHPDDHFQSRNILACSFDFQLSLKNYFEDYCLMHEEGN